MPGRCFEVAVEVPQGAPAPQKEVRCLQRRTTLAGARTCFYPSKMLTESSTASRKNYPRLASDPNSSASARDGGWALHIGKGALASATHSCIDIVRRHPLADPKLNIPTTLLGRCFVAPPRKKRCFSALCRTSTRPFWRAFPPPSNTWAPNLAEPPCQSTN